MFAKTGHVAFSKRRVNSSFEKVSSLRGKNLHPLAQIISFRAEIFSEVVYMHILFMHGFFTLDQFYIHDVLVVPVSFTIYIVYLIFYLFVFVSIYS